MWFVLPEERPPKEEKAQNAERFPKMFRELMTV